jgi:hypothetical protein
MPFKSKAQARYLFAKHPKLARKWAKKYGGYKSKPERVKSKSKSRKRSRRR